MSSSEQNTVQDTSSEKCFDNKSIAVTSYIKTHKFSVPYKLRTNKINENDVSKTLDFIHSFNKKFCVFCGEFMEILIQYTLKPNSFLFERMYVEINKDVMNLILRCNEYYNSVLGTFDKEFYFEEDIFTEDNAEKTCDYKQSVNAKKFKWLYYNFADDFAKKTLDFKFICILIVFFYNIQKKYASKYDIYESLYANMIYVIDNFVRIYDIVEYLQVLRDFFEVDNVSNEECCKNILFGWFVSANDVKDALCVNGYIDMIINKLNISDEAVSVSSCIIDIKCCRNILHAQWIRQLYLYKLGLLKEFSYSYYIVQKIRLFVVNVFENVIYEYIVSEDVIL